MISYFDFDDTIHSNRTSKYLRIKKWVDTEADEVKKLLGLVL